MSQLTTRSSKSAFDDCSTCDDGFGCLNLPVPVSSAQWIVPEFAKKKKVTFAQQSTNKSFFNHTSLEKRKFTLWRMIRIDTCEPEGHVQKR